MPIKIQFPDPNLADDEGLVAVGGNLSAEFLLAAYQQGLFPWFNEGDPILWWSPNPRMVLFPDEFKCSNSLHQVIRSKKYTVKTDTNFEKVIKHCASVIRRGQNGTWITGDIIEAYSRLNHEGYAHSFETYRNNSLVGGLYGVTLGKAFFGESMFFLERDASKVALYYLVQVAKKKNFKFIDVQQSTEHLKSLGARDMDRSEFLKILQKAVQLHGKNGRWDYEF